MFRRLVVLLLTVIVVSPAAFAGEKQAADFQPDPRGVQRYGPGYRYWQSGWIVLHIEGKPYERGVQHGHLLAPEIAANIRCYAATQNPTSPTEGWKQTRLLANAVFLRRYDEEYLEEMKGIAAGASAAGAKFDGRAVDLLDVVALNAWPEIDSLDSALNATPTGLEGIRFPRDSVKTPPAPKPMRCSAFAANGKATKDGKIVFGHITMFSLYPSNFYNVWIDAQGSAGHRVLMQSYPGGMQSGLDYYMNDVGLLISETTLAQTRFNGKGLALGSRIRKAIQYADSIDQAVKILREDNNGLYTNEWLLADIKTNEIAMFELGTHKDRLYRSGKDEWFGGTEGFYWGCNNTKDLEVRLETIASVKARPAAMVFCPSDRDQMWLRLYDKHKGKIDADFGKLAFTTPPLAAYHSVDAKFTTTDMARELKTYALFGPPLGKTWQPTAEELKKYPEVRPLVGNPWTILHASPPAETKPDLIAVDLHDVERGGTHVIGASHDPQTEAAWHGTLFPKTDADIWLAVAFAHYERYVALEAALRKRSDGKLTAADKGRLAVELFSTRAAYNLGARQQPEKSLADTKADLRTDSWYEVASSKGVLLLHALRQNIGADQFDALMQELGHEYAGKEISTAEFRAFIAKKTNKDVEAFFDLWLTKTGLPNEKSAETASSGPFSVLTFHHELEETLIVYGTLDEANTNREAAEALQHGIVARHSNYTVPIKSDREVTEDDMKKNHIILIGRPKCNRLTMKYREVLPIQFGTASFVLNGEAYAHQGSAVVVAAENPLNKRYSLVVLAGLNGSSTLSTATHFMHEYQAAEAIVFPNGTAPRSMVIAGRGTKAAE